MSNKLLESSLIAVLVGAQSAVRSLAGQSSLRIVHSISTPRMNTPATKRESRTHSAYVTYGYANGPGWTCAHVKRMATKRRNQQRNKRAHGG